MKLAKRIAQMMKPAGSVVIALVLALAATAAHAAVTISTDKTRNMSCAGGVCTPTGNNANLNVNDLQTMLGSSDVTVKTGTSTASLGVLSPLAWASSHRLTLDAFQFIHVRAAVAVQGTAGLTLITNDGGTGGDLTFESGASVTFWDLTSSLIINRQRYTLVNDIKALASDIAAGPSRNYALSSDFDASPYNFHSSPVPTVFTGTFEGLGHTISNLLIKTGRSQRQTGLFVDLGPRGTLRDIGLVNANVTGTYSYYSPGVIGALVAENDGKIVSAYATGSVSGLHAVAGALAGLSTGTIVMSYSTMAVGCSDHSAGGLVGYMRGGLIESSHASGPVGCSGSTDAGGLVGVVGAGRVLNSFATGAVSAYGSNASDAAVAGGLAAANAGTIAFCFATGNATAHGSEGEADGTGYAAGLITSNQGTIHDSYATGNSIAGPDTDAGGLVEENRGSISNTYSTGTVSASQRGGLLGQDYSTTANSYWDFDTSGITDPHQGAGDPLDDPGITGLTDAQLKSALPPGFNPAIWGQDPAINNGWPYLLANPPQ
jgi:hypothetical protein